MRIPSLTPSQPIGALVAGVGLAANRDAAAAFRYRSDLPIQGQHAYAFGISQTGRFLRQFLYDGFNVDERDRRVFDAMWIHIAGAARGTFNERFATPTLGDVFRPTKFPFAVEQVDVDGTRGGLQSRYRRWKRPRWYSRPGGRGAAGDNYRLEFPRSVGRQPAGHLPTLGIGLE